MPAPGTPGVGRVEGGEWRVGRDETQYRTEQVAARGQTNPAVLPYSVLPFIARNVTLAGID
ncbi:hypothetical protein B1218_35705, partial [Pseudomonas ogarae]